MPQFRLPDGSLLGADAPVRAAPAAPAKPVVRFRLPDGTELGAQDVSAPAIEDLPTGDAVDRYEAENPGFGNRTGQRLTKGVRNLQAGVNANDAVNAQRELELLDLVEAEANRGEANQKFRQQLRDQNGGRVPLNTFRSGERTISVYRVMTPEQRAQARQELQASLTEGITGTIRRTAQAAAIPSSPAATRIAEAESFGEGVERFTEAPLSAMGELVTSSLPAMAPGIAAAIITKRPALSMGGGSAYVESVSSLVDGLQKAGVNVMDEAQVLAALQDPAIREQVAQDAQTRGLVIGIVDALAARAGSMVLAPKSLSPTAREVVNIPSQVVAGVGSGMAGEAGAQIATEGSVTEPGAVVAEGVGEGPTQVVEVGVGVRRAAKTPSDETPPPSPPPITPVDEQPLTRRSLEDAIKANDLSDQGQVATSRPVAPAEDPEGVDAPETASAAPEPPESVEDPEDDAAILAHAETVARDLGFELDDETRQEVLEAARNGEFVEDVLDEYADVLSFSETSGFETAARDQGFSIHEDDNATEEAAQPGEDADIREGGETVPAGARPLDGDGGRGGSPAQEARRDQGEPSGREAAPDDLTERRERHALYNRIRAGRRPTEDGSRGFSMIQEIIRRGGVDPDSPLASEFRGMDVMNPRFFRRGGMKDVDDFHVSDLGLESVFPNRIEDGRLLPEDVYDLVAREKSGQRVLTDEDAALNADSRAADFDELSRILDQELGLDIQALSNAEVDRAQDIASQLPAGLDRDEIGARITRQIMRERADADPDDIQAALTARTGEVATSAPARRMEKAEARETVRRYNPSINKVRVGFKNKTEAAIYMVAAARKGTKNADAGRAYLQDQGYSDRDIDTMASGARASVRDHLKGAKPRKGKVLIPAGTISDEFAPVAKPKTEPAKQEEPKPRTPRVERTEPEPAELASLGVSKEGTVNGSHIADMQDQREARLNLAPATGSQQPSRAKMRSQADLRRTRQIAQGKKSDDPNAQEIAAVAEEMIAVRKRLSEMAANDGIDLMSLHDAPPEGEVNQFWSNAAVHLEVASEIIDAVLNKAAAGQGVTSGDVAEATTATDRLRMKYRQVIKDFDDGRKIDTGNPKVRNELDMDKFSHEAGIARGWIKTAAKPDAGANGAATEQTDQGEQNVIPGAEREPLKDTLDRRAQGRSQPKAPQKPADDGLFDLGARNQQDLDLRPSDEAETGTPDIQQAVIDEAERLGLGNIVSRLILNPYLRIGDKRVAGAYDRGENLLFVALAEADPKRTLRHEAIHAMRHMNVITRKEWGVLARKAHKTWRKQYDVEGRWGNFFDGWPDEVVQDKLTEEGVAEAFADHVSGARKQTGTVAGILNRMAKFIEALGNALRGLGFRTYEDVFNALDRGERVAGEPRDAAGRMLSPAANDNEVSEIVNKLWLRYSDGQLRKMVIDEARFIFEDNTASDDEMFERGVKEGLSQTMPQSFHDSAESVRDEIRVHVQDMMENGSPPALRLGRDNTVSWGPRYLRPTLRQAAIMVAEEKERAVFRRAEELIANGKDARRLKQALTRYKNLAAQALKSPDDYDLDFAAFRAFMRLEEATSVSFSRPSGLDPHDDVMLMPVDNGTRQNGGEQFGHVYDELSVHNSRILANSNKTLLQRVRDLRGSKTKPIALAVRRALMDSFADLQEVQANLERESDLNHLPEHQDANMAQELYRSRTGNALINARQNLYEPLIDRMKELDVDVETLETYLVARHAEERNNQIAKINPDMPDGGSGMSTDEANAVLESLADRQEALNELAGKVDSILAEARRLMVHYGLESQETIDTWEQTYQNYVPLRGRDFDEESVFAMPGEVSMPPVAPSGPNFSVRGPESKRAMGRGDNNPAVNVLAYALQIHQSAIVRGEKNRVGQTLMNLVNDFPDPDFWTINTPTEKRVINPSTGLVTTQVDPLFANRDDVVHIKVDGVGVILHLKHAPLAKAMRNIGNDSGNMLLKVMQQVNIWLSLVNTAQNPEFVISNFFRDLQTAFINMSEDDLVSVRKQTMKDIKKAWSGLRNLDKGADTEWAGYAKEFGQNGGRISFMGLRSVEQEAAKMRKAVKQSGNLRPDQHFMKVGGAIFDLFERHNGYIENAIRLSAYVNLRRAGAPPAKAAQAALNLTVNFNRKGTWGTALNSAYLFYNATVQGNLRIAQALLRSKRVQKMVAGIAAAGFMADMMNAMMAPDDDDDDNSYDRDIPEWVKQTNMVVMLGKGEAIKVPMPYGYNWFWNVGRNISAATRRQMGIGTGKKPLEAAADIGINLIDTFNPLGGSESLWAFVSPTVGDPFVAWLRNEDFAGRPIRPENPTHGTGQPVSQMYWNSTGEIPKFVADKLNRLTGGNEFVPGEVDVSPDGLEYVFEFATGAAGAFWNRNVNNIITIANGEVPEIQNVPFVRKVWQGRSEYLDKNRFYERHAAIDLAANNVKGLRQNGKFKEATRAYREQDRLVRLKPVFDKARRQLQKVSQQKQIVRASDRPNKQAMLDRLAAAEKRILDRANGAFNRLRADEQE